MTRRLFIRGKVISPNYASFKKGAHPGGDKFVVWSKADGLYALFLSIDRGRSADLFELLLAGGDPGTEHRLRGGTGSLYRVFPLFFKLGAGSSLPRMGQE